MIPTIQFKFHLPHSCYPNCALNSQNQLVSLREIHPAEEWTIDYSTLFTGHALAGICKCGHNGCRGRILGFNQLPVIFQDYYLENDAVCQEVLGTLKVQSQFFPGLSNHRNGTAPIPPKFPPSLKIISFSTIGIRIN